MKRLFLSILVFSVCSICKGQIGFQKSISMPDSNLYLPFSNILTLPDSSFLILCRNQVQFTGLTTRSVIVKINRTGNIIWQKVISTDTVIDLRYINYASSGYLITGMIRHPSYHQTLLVIKIDFNGDTLWTRAYPQAGAGHFIKQMSNGDLLILGSSTYIPGQPPLNMAMRTDSFGNIIYANIYPGNWSGDATGFATSDGGSLLHDPGLTFKKIDSAGNLMWTTPDFNSIFAVGITETNDSSYIAVGPTFSTESIIIKVNTTGDTIWSRSIGSPLFNTQGSSIKALSDGGFVICGVADYPNSNNYHRPLLVRIDSLANVLWSKTYTVNNNSTESSFALNTTNDNGFIIAGNSYDTIQNISSVIIIKTDSIGNSGCLSYDANIINVPNPSLTGTVLNIPVIPITATLGNVTFHINNGLLSVIDSCVQTSSIIDNMVSNFNSVLIFPNPFSYNLNITTSIEEPIEFILYDMTSRKVLQSQISTSTILNTEQLADGIYLYEVRGKNGKQKQGKVVKN